MHSDANSSQKPGEETRKNCPNATGETLPPANKPEDHDRAATEDELLALLGPDLARLWQVEPWPEPVDGQVLLDQLADTYNRFVVLPSRTPEMLALFTPHTYAFHLRDVSTYLGLESPEKRCGKSTLMAVLVQLVHRPLATANISSPAFFHAIEQTQPTLLIDETDTFLRKKAELRGILNAGYTRPTAYVIRLINEARRRPNSGSGHSLTALQGQRLARFSCWCPKVIATIGHLNDTLADRCILLNLQRKEDHEKRERVRSFNGLTLRRQCLRFVLDHAQAIATAQPALPTGLNDRAADLWEPLFVLADLAGGRWPELARQAAVEITTRTQQTSPILSLLLDIYWCYINAKTDRLFSRDLVWYLNSLAGQPKPWITAASKKQIDELWLAQQLRPYDIRPRTIWINNRHAKGYLQEQFNGTLLRYLSPGELDTLLEHFK